MVNSVTQTRPSYNQPTNEPPTKPSMLLYYARRLIVQPVMVDIAFRLLGARALPGAVQQHFITQGLNANDVRRAIAR